MSTTVDILGSAFRLRFERRQLAPIDASPTPLAGWNRVCRDDGGGVGLARGWFVVIGGNPKFGKSILALNLAAAAMSRDQPVGFVSLEMSPEQLAARFYAMKTKTPVRMLEKGGFTKDHFDQVWNKIKPTSNGYRFEVTDTPLWDLGTVMAEMEAMWDSGISWFVVDYLQLVGLGDEEEINRQVSSVTTHLAQFAKAKPATVIALSQFNRQTSKDYTQPPRAQGLHGGMIVEATADQVILLDHSRYEKSDGRAKSWLIVDLNRHGESGCIPIEWDYTTLSVREALPDEERSWPTA
jgi:replicative DNA helicase